MLDNAANDGLFPEHYLVTVPFDSPALVDIRSSAANDASDRLVLTGTDSADRYLLRPADAIRPAPHRDHPGAANCKRRRQNVPTHARR